MALSLSFPSKSLDVDEPDRKITLTLPVAVVHELKRRMATEDTTMRVLVLSALANAGYHVGEADLRDRRRR